MNLGFPTWREGVFFYSRIHPPSISFLLFPPREPRFFSQPSRTFYLPPIFIILSEDEDEEEEEEGWGGGINISTPSHSKVAGTEFVLKRSLLSK